MPNGFGYQLKKDISYIYWLGIIIANTDKMWLQCMITTHG